MASHRFRIEGKDYEVSVGARAGSTITVTVNGKAYAVETSDERAVAAPTPSQRAATPPPPSPRAAPVGAASDGEVLAPISGVVLSVNVSAGDSVAPGDVVLVLEAMKMENEIFAPCAGTVSEVSAKPQQEVREGEPLLKVDPA